MAYIRRRILKDGRTPAYLAVWKEHPSGPDRRRRSLARLTPNDISSMFSTGSSRGPTRRLTSVVRPSRRLPTDTCLDQRGDHGPANRRRSDCGTPSPSSETGRSSRSGRVMCRLSCPELPLAPSTIRVVMQHVSAVFATALDDGLIEVATHASECASRDSPTHPCCHYRSSKSWHSSTMPMSGSPSPSPSVQVWDSVSPRRPGHR